MLNSSKNLSCGFLSKKLNDKLEIKHSAFTPFKSVGLKHSTVNIFATVLPVFGINLAFLPFLYLCKVKKLSFLLSE